MRQRVVLTIIDQALASASNVGTAVVAARALDRPSFGAFGLAVAIFLLAQGMCRALVMEPLLSRHSHLTWHEMAQPAREATGAALVFGLASSAVLLLAAPLVGGPSGRALAALVVVLPGLLLQDAWRYCFFAGQRPAAAVANDALWCGVQVVLLVGLAAYGTWTAGNVLLWWGGAGTIAGVVGCAQASAVPSPLSAWRWIRGHAELGGRYAAEFATSTGAGQGTLLALAAIAGLVAVGSVRGAQVFFGPINVLFGGMYMALVPEGVRLTGEPRRLRRLMVVGSLALMAAATVWLLLGLGLPARAGRALFGDTWEGSRGLLLAVGIAVVGGGAASGAIAGLRALGAARASLRARVLGAPLVVVLPVVGALSGAPLFAAGMAVATWAGAFIWWHQFDRALRLAQAG